MDYKEGVGLLDEAEDEDDGRASPINRAIVPQNSNQVGLLCWCCIHLYLIFSQFFFMLTQIGLARSLSSRYVCRHQPQTYHSCKPSSWSQKAFGLLWFANSVKVSKRILHLFPPLPLSSSSFSFVWWYYAY